MSGWQATRSAGLQGSIGARFIRLLRSRKWLLGWIFFYLWLAFFLGLWHLTPTYPKATLLAGKDPKLHAFSPDNKTLALSAKGDGEGCRTVQVWDPDNGRAGFAVGTDTIWSSDGRLIATTSEGEDPEVRLWELTTGMERVDLYPELGIYGYPIRFSPDGRFLIVEITPRLMQHFPTFECIDLAANGPNPLFVGGDERFGRGGDWIAFSPDGRTVAIVRHDLEKTAIEHWRVGEPGQPFTLEQSRTIDGAQIVLSPTLNTFASAKYSYGGLNVAEIKLWDFATGKVKAATRQTFWNSKLDLQFSLDGQSFFIHNWSSDNASVTCLDCETGRSISSKLNARQLLLVSPDHRWTLALDVDGADVLETASCTKRGELRIAGDSPCDDNWNHTAHCLFSPDSRTVVITDLSSARKPDPITAYLMKCGIGTWSSQTVPVARLWDVERCKELACFEDCHQALYSPDGKTLATVHADGTVKLWDVPPRKPALVILGMSLVFWFAVIVGLQLWTRFIRRTWVRRSAAAP